MAIAKIRLHCILNKLLNFLKDTLKAFDDFINKQNSVRSNDFWYVKEYIFWKFIQYSIHWDKWQMLRKFLSEETFGKNMLSFYLRDLQLITVLHLICDSYMSWSTRFVSLKLCVGFSILDSASFSSITVYIFVQQITWTLWLENVKIPFKTFAHVKNFLPHYLFFKPQILQKQSKSGNIYCQMWPDVDIRCQILPYISSDDDIFDIIR